MAAAASVVEGVVDATTFEGVCEVVDIEVEVVSTTTVLVEEVAAGTGTAAGAVDRITGEVELSATGEAT